VTHSFHGYSDRVSHALAFTAKHYGAAAPAGATMAFLAHPANVALILARYGVDQATVVAGILHHVLEEAAGSRRIEMEQKVGEKFGPVVLAIARDAVEPKFDERGQEQSWRVCKQEYLVLLAAAEPRALDICVADELQRCGNTSASLRRLGVEYLRTISSASAEQTIWWYRSLIEILERRPEWPHREMLDELRMLSADLVRSLQRSQR
jgi:(p)ppGpp synthase/HD superfamily hydrolase